MKKRKLRLIALLLATVILSGVLLTACMPEQQDSDDIGKSSEAPTETPTEESTDPPSEWQPPEDEYILEREDSCRQITFYWTHPNLDIATSDIWVWWDGKEGSGYLMHECDYGAKAVINVPENITQVGFIVRRDCSDPGSDAWGDATKDFSEDRFAILEGDSTYIWLKPGDGAQYTSNDGKTLMQIKKFTLAGIIDLHKIQYSVTPALKLTGYKQISVYQGEKKMTITDITNLGVEASNAVITLDEEIDISKEYRVVIEGYGEKSAVPTKIFDSAYFKDNFHYDGDDLGSTINGSNTTFKVWAPTASKVVLDLYNSGHEGEAYKKIEMVRGDKGVWSHTEACGHGTYYTYTVTTSVGTQIATDPYAKAAGLNGNRSMVVDLDSTDPEGWEADRAFTTGIDNYTDATIWEVHVRDFSNKISSSQYKGKYLAFTEKGLTNSAGVPVGIDYLIELGITHVHLLPVYDYATVNEADPDSGFNWGYDPKNYNVPEGSYSTDPTRGEVRIKEFKEMVQALHNAGIGVIMDVVYNHTYDANSSFNKIVPYYYYRYTNTGANSSASGCGNDTASERYMYGKFMVESASYWMEEYNLDGLRYDLMGLHDLETMKKVEAAVHTIDPKALIYGEGWTMGSTINNSAQANQGNISKVPTTNDAAGSIAVFNDVIRDGLKGSVFNESVGGYINGVAAGNLPGIKFGIQGGSVSGQSWKVNNAMVINYMSAHDNHTLWDKLALTCPDASIEERMAMNRLGAVILMISQGTPFMQAGEEMLRTKDGDYNSYKSSDEINNIKWDNLTPESNEYTMMQYYKGLFEMRKAFDIFTNGTRVAVSFKDLGSGAVMVTFDNHMGGKAVAVINPTKSAVTATLDGEYRLVVNGTTSGSETISTASGEISVSAISACIYIK